MKSPREITHNGQTLSAILDAHYAWVRGFGGERADLSGADLSEADLYEADLRRADLRGAILTNARLTRCDLSAAKMSGTQLNGAYLSTVEMCGTDLSNANLNGAHLKVIDMSEAEPEWIELDGADPRTDLRGTDMSEAYLIDVFLTNAIYNSRTKWPDYFNPNDAGAKLVDVEEKSSE